MTAHTVTLPTTSCPYTLPIATQSLSREISRLITGRARAVSHWSQLARHLDWVHVHPARHRMWRAFSFKTRFQIESDIAERLAPCCKCLHKSASCNLRQLHGLYRSKLNHSQTNDSITRLFSPLTYRPCGPTVAPFLVV